MGKMKIQIGPDGRVYKSDSWSRHFGFDGNKLVMDSYILSFPTEVEVGGMRAPLAQHDIPGRRLVYKAENGHSMRIYY